MGSGILKNTQVVIKTNNYQLFREDSEREKDFFEAW